MNRKEYALLVEGWENYLKSGHFESSESLNNFLIKEGVSDIWSGLKSRFGNLGDGLKNKPFRDSFEVVIESLAPKLTERIREAQIDHHVAEWREGFETRSQELSMGSGGYPASGGLSAEYDDSKSDDWNAGYAFRAENAGNVWDSELEKMVVEKGIDEWNDLVEVNVVTTSIKDFLNVLNPVELVKHMIHAIKKHGFKVALPVIVAEVVMHTLPIWGSKILGPKAALIISQIPITEILTPAYLKFITGQSGEPEADGYLDKYEKEYGDVPL